MSFSDLPHVNVLLNGASAIALVSGYSFIRRKKITAHKVCMLTAFGASMLFLVLYVIYHHHVGYTRFTGQGWLRVIYFSILIPHTILAIVAVVPLTFLTLYRALRGQFDKHRGIARWTFPIWLYVSVTGILIYWMLYHLT